MRGKFWRKALAASLALLIVSGSVPIQPLSQVFEDIAITASAESTITPVTPQLDSDGFYSIGSAEELYGFAELVNSGNASANAKLTTDIVVNENVLDANGEANTGDFVQWTPIGNNFFEDKVYSGTFDGQGHTISGLYVSGNGWYVGFVGQVSGTAIVKNLGIVDSYFSSSNNFLGSIVGGVAEKSSVTIANVYSTSTVKGDNWIGGLAGGGGGSVTLINCYFAGKTSSTWPLGHGSHHDDLVAGDFDRSTLTVCNAFVLGTSRYGTSVTAEQLSDGTVAAALHYYQDALADGSMFGLSGGKTNFSGTIDGVSVTTADVTLHTFDGDATTYSSKYIVGNTTPLPVNVVRDGYRFSGWYDNADFEGDAVTKISSFETDDKEYWAKFERSHSVTFVLNYGYIQTGEIDHYIEGETTALPTVVFKDGASFEGWYTTEDFTGDRYYSIPATATEDMTFYAKWGTEKTTFYLVQGGSPEPVNVLYEGENLVWLDETTMDSYAISDNSGNLWGSDSGINVPYTGGESTFGFDASELSVAQSGFYVFTLTDKGDGNWFISVLRSLVNYGNITDIADQTYTGSAIEPEIIVTDGEKTLTLGTDYEVTYSDNTNAGTAKATITGKGNYGGTIVKTFAINKADLTSPGVSINGWTYGNEPNAPEVSGNSGQGVAAYLYKVKDADDSTYNTKVPTNAGDYTVKAIIPETHNYNGASVTANFTIAKKALTITANAKSKTYGEEDPALTYNASGLVTGDTISGALTREAGNNVGTYAIKLGTLTAGDNYTISFTGANFTINKADFSSDLNVTIGDWVAGTTAKTPSVDGNVSEGEVSYQYKAIDAEDSSYKSTPPTTAGAYTVKATVAETANYKAATATANFTVIAPNFTTPSYSWNQVDGKWNCTASRTCTNAASLSETETVTATSSVKTPATCANKGTTTYTATFENKAFATQTQDVDDIAIDTDAHDWNDTIYVWSVKDNIWYCTATRYCKNDKTHKEYEIATVTSEVTTPATCTTNGITTYTATFTNPAFETKTKKEADVPATGHHYGLLKWIINKDFTEAQAVFGCKDCDEGQEIVDAEITSVTTEPTYTSAGKTVYTAYVVFNGKGYSYEKTVTIPKIGLTHVEAVEPTCTEAGNIEYWFDEANNKYFTDANGENEITQAKTVVKAKGHSYGAPEWTWADDNSATAKFTCSEGDDEQIVKATVTSKTTDPTYIAEGKTVYTATVTFGGKSYTDTKTVTTDKLTYTAPTVSFLRGDGAVKLEWNAVEGAEQYGIAGYIDGKWTLLDKTNDTSFILTPLTAGEEYRVAVVTKLNGKWFNDFSKSILVSPKAPEVHVYPQITSIDYNEQYHQFKLNWSAVPNAENYGVAVYLAGKWKILTQTIPAGTTSFTSPKLKAGQTYKMLVCAKVNGKWDLNAITSRAFEVTVK